MSQINDISTVCLQGIKVTGIPSIKQYLVVVDLIRNMPCPISENCVDDVYGSCIIGSKFLYMLSNHDGLEDGDEVNSHATDPLDPDSDDDSLSQRKHAPDRQRVTCRHRFPYYLSR